MVMSIQIASATLLQGEWVNVEDRPTTARCLLRLDGTEVEDVARLSELAGAVQSAPRRW
jgi:hypothetical protein